MAGSTAATVPLTDSSAPLFLGGALMVDMGRALHRHCDAAGARTALTLAVMVLTGDQLGQCQRSLAWCAEHRPSSADWKAAVQELRDAIAAREEER